MRSNWPKWRSLRIILALVDLLSGFVAFTVKIDPESQATSISSLGTPGSSYSRMYLVGLDMRRHRGLINLERDAERDKDCNISAKCSVNAHFLICRFKTLGHVGMIRDIAQALCKECQ